MRVAMLACWFVHPPFLVSTTTVTTDGCQRPPEDKSYWHYSEGNSWCWSLSSMLPMLTSSACGSKCNKVSQVINIYSTPAVCGCPRGVVLGRCLQTGRRPYPAGIWLRSQSACCCCQPSRPGGPPSPSCRSPSGKWSRWTLCRHFWNTHTQKTEIGTWTFPSRGNHFLFCLCVTSFSACVIYFSASVSLPSPASVSLPFLPLCHFFFCLCHFLFWLCVTSFICFRVTSSSASVSLPLLPLCHFLFCLCVTSFACPCVTSFSASPQWLTRCCAAGSRRPCIRGRSCSGSSWIWPCRRPAGSPPASPRSPARRQRGWWGRPCRSPGRSPHLQSRICSRTSAWHSSCYRRDIARRDVFMINICIVFNQDTGNPLGAALTRCWARMTRPDRASGP